MAAIYMGQIPLQFRGAPIVATSKHDENLRALKFPGEIRRISSVSKKGAREGQLVERRITVVANGFVRPGTQLGITLDEIFSNLEEAASNGILLAYKATYRAGIRSLTGTELKNELTRMGRHDLTALITKPNAAAVTAFGL